MMICSHVLGIIIVLCATVVHKIVAFLPPQQVIQNVRLRTSLGITFGNIFNGKRNDNKPTSSPVMTTIEFLPTKVTIEAFEGQSLEEVAAAAGVEIKYKCKKGECGTCEVNVDGKWIKACQTTIPAVNAGDVWKVTVKPELKKKSATFFSPQSFVDGFVNNAVGVVGFATTATSKADDEYAKRIAREQALAEKVAARKAAKSTK